MVFYSQTAIDDLDNILWGLVSWNKFTIDYEHAASYADDVKNSIAGQEYRKIHIACTDTKHLQYGKYIFRYKRNRNTVWYLIYDIDEDNEVVYVNKILNNYPVNQ